MGTLLAISSWSNSTHGKVLKTFLWEWGQKEDVAVFNFYCLSFLTHYQGSLEKSLWTTNTVLPQITLPFRSQNRFPEWSPALGQFSTWMCSLLNVLFVPIGRDIGGLDPHFKGIPESIWYPLWTILTAISYADSRNTCTRNYQNKVLWPSNWAMLKSLETWCRDFLVPGCQISLSFSQSWKGPHSLSNHGRW